MQLAHCAAANLTRAQTVLACSAKANVGLLRDLTSAHVGRHDNHGVAEVDRLALAVGKAALLEHLQQDVEDVGVRLFDLVEQHDRVRMATHSLGKLAALVVTHITRRATNELGNLELAAELRHVKADERVLAAKQILGKRLCKLGLTGTRRAQEDERTAGTTRIFKG